MTDPVGKAMLTMLSAVAELERDLLIERTQAGLERAKSQGKKLGRRPSLSETDRIAVREQGATGVSVSKLARDYGVSRATILRAVNI
jgi:putative DNA-invertase from lambdoid prophage Rac